MKDYQQGNPPTQFEMKFRTKVKEFFFCDADVEVCQQEKIWCYLLILTSGIAFIAGVYGMVGSWFS